MKNRNLALTIGSVVLGAGLVFGPAAYANHGHTGNTTATGMGMMGAAPRINQQTPGGHMGAGNGGHMGTPVTTAKNHHDMQGTAATQGHMTDSAANTAITRHHGTTDHHKGFDSKPAK